jgi:SgrR family transcriptional regulator
MILVYYLELFLRFPKMKVDESIEVSLVEISNILFCTVCNSKLTLKKLEKLGWMICKLGKGRGNKSLLTFREEPDRLIWKIGIILILIGIAITQVSLR